MRAAVGSAVIDHLRRTVRADALADVPDAELLAQFAANRDEGAFAALLRRHGPMVWGVCRRLARDRQDSEDAFQVTFLVLARKAASIRRRELLANWLFGVARRAALNARLTRARRSQHEQGCRNMPDVQVTLETPWNDSSAVLDEELARLPDKYRLPLLLCGLEGLTHADAGKQLGWPTGTVAGRLSRGRELLRTRLRRRGVTISATALATVLGKDAAVAAVPAALLATTAGSAAALVTGGVSGAAVVSANVASLMDGVLKKMFLSRLMTATVVVAVLVVTLSGAAAIWQWTQPSSAPLESALGPQIAPSKWELPPKPAENEQANPGKPALWLPEDPAAVVFRLERFVEPHQGPRTTVIVHADGRVIAEVPERVVSFDPVALTRHARERAKTEDIPPEKIKVFEGKLSSAELHELLRFALHDQEFFDFDTDAVRSAILDEYKVDRSASSATDTSTTQLYVQTRDQSHEVTWPKLTPAAWFCPKVKRLGQLHAVDRRLQQLFYVLLAGGPERVEAAVNHMHELVKGVYQRFPHAPRLTADDLFGVALLADGSVTQFTFLRNRNFHAVRDPLFEVTINVPRQGKPTLQSHSVPR